MKYYPTTLLWSRERHSMNCTQKSFHLSQPYEPMFSHHDESKMNVRPELLPEKNIMNYKTRLFFKKKISSSLAYSERIRISFNKNRFDPSDAIGIFGSPRSGTTWLMDLLSTIPRYLSISEPLHRVWYPRSLEHGFTTRTFIEPDIKSEMHRSYLDEVFKGNVVSIRPHFGFRDIPKRFHADRAVVKFVRGNRLIPWINNNFDLRGTILIIRDPCSTISSQIRTRVRGYYLPKGENLKLEVVLREARGLVSERIYDELKQIGSEEGVLAASWALDQYVPLYYKSEYDLILVSYERLVLEPEKELKRILTEIGYEESIGDILAKIEVPSSTGQDHRSNRMEQLNKWRTHLSVKQIEEIMNVVDIFDMDFYHDDIMPDMDRMNDHNKEHDPVI